MACKFVNAIVSPWFEDSYIDGYEMQDISDGVGITELRLPTPEEEADFIDGEFEPEQEYHMLTDIGRRIFNHGEALNHPKQALTPSGQGAGGEEKDV